MVKKDNFGRTVTIKIKSDEFKTLTRSKTFGHEIRELDELIDIAHQLLLANQHELNRVRLLGVTASNLSREVQGEGIQLEIDFKDLL